MKPHRVKRVDPLSRPGEFSPPAWDDAGSTKGSPTRPALGVCRSRARGCTFSAVECHDRFCGGHKPGDEVASRFAARSVIRRRGGHAAGSRTLAASAGFGPFWGSRPRTHCFAGRRNRAPDTGPSAGDASGQWRIGRSSTRPVLKHGPRSLACARVMGLLRNPKAQ